jgi:cell division protein ZapE
VPFIKKIKTEMEILELNGPNDYRYDRIKGIDVYYTPVDQISTQRMRDAFFAMTDRDLEDAASVTTAELEVGVRTLHVPKSSKGVAVFSFKRLCANPLGAADYLAISWVYHTVFIVAIPKFTKDKRDQAKRFVTLIDTLYENNVKLICSAEVDPHDLYPKGDGSFEFERTVSRLVEMQSQKYLARGHAV